MSVSHENSPQADAHSDDLADLGAQPDNSKAGVVLVVLVAALLLMAGTIIAGVPLVLKVGAMNMQASVDSREYPQLQQLRSFEAEALSTAKKLDNGLFRIPIAAGKAALLANPSLLASAGEGAAPAPEPVADPDAPPKTEEELVAEGAALFSGAKICMSCHKADSTDRLVGPGLKGIFGRTGKLADGTEYTVDEAYLIESLKDPNAKVVEGFPPAMLPQTFTDGELAALVAYLKTL